MAKATKLSVLFGAIVIALSATYFVWLQPESKPPLADSKNQAQGVEQELSVQTDSENNAGTNLIEPEAPLTQSPALNQERERVRPQESERSRIRTSLNSSFSSALDQIVSQEQLIEDTASYVAEIEDLGLVTYLHGDKNKPVYGLLDGVINRPDSLHKKFDKSVEEIVDLAQQGDPSAMLSLANRAWAAGHWAEGDVYAFEAARMSNSWEPIMHGASQRLGSLGAGYRDPEGASWFLAAYLTGEIAAAEHVAGYFRFMTPEHQSWALERAREIIDDVNTGG